MIPQVIFSCLLSIGIFFLAFHLEVGEMGLASNCYALIVVLGGTLSATLIAYPWQKLAWMVQLLKPISLSPSRCLTLEGIRFD